MANCTINVECPVHDSFRVQQVAGLFDLPVEARTRETFCVELPPTDGDWQIGLITGPSGSGKSTVAHHSYGKQLYQASPWPTERAVVDAMGELPARQITELLTAVGFSSPPSWVKPYQVLSNGERFRCDLAKALAGALTAETTPLIAFDEFTSVVDRKVAKICSAAIARAIRSDKVPCRFVAVTCHYDVAEWLEADWVLDMATRQLTWRCLRRPPVELEVYRTDLEAWSLFARHHYLSSSLALQSECYLTTWNGEPVNFCATLPVVGRRGHRRFTRIVTLPDYQGIGIGTRSMWAVAQLHRQRGHRVSVTSSHPALIHHCRHSPDWRTVSVKRTGASRARSTAYANYRTSNGRAVVSFEFVGRTANPNALLVRAA